MSVKDILLALCVVIIWGLNFIAIKIGVTDLPPLLFGGLRFIAVVIPAIFFVPRPKIALKWLIIYGLTISFLQFSFLFCAIRFGMPAGLASLVLQCQAFFTIILGMLFFGEQIRVTQLLGMFVAIFGIVLLAKVSIGGTSGSSISLVGFLFTIAGGFSWALGNITNKMILKNTSNINALSLVVWAGLIPIIPFFLSSWVFEGIPLMISSLAKISWITIAAIAYVALFASIIGYGLWGYLLSRYETWRIAPLSLLVPIVGLLSASLFLGETLNMFQVTGASFIILGLLISMFGDLFYKLLKRSLQMRN